MNRESLRVEKLVAKWNKRATKEGRAKVKTSNLYLEVCCPSSFDYKVNSLPCNKILLHVKVSKGERSAHPGGRMFPPSPSSRGASLTCATPVS